MSSWLNVDQRRELEYDLIYHVLTEIRMVSLIVIVDHCN